MLNDMHIIKSVSELLQRSERQQDLQKLVRSFVDIGVMPQLQNRNNQIIYGRRGTGKTHVLKVLKNILETEKNNTVLYIDARTLGSTAQFTDINIPLKLRCISLFRDILTEIYNELLERVVSQPKEIANEGFELLVAMSGVITHQVKTLKENVIKLKTVEGQTSRSGKQFSASLTNGLFVKAEGSTEATKGVESEKNIEVTHDDKIIFPELYTYIKELLNKLNTSMYILFDEWSSIPEDVQPYLAEFIKRSFLPNPSLIIKIASLEFRSKFNLRNENGGITGIEVGSDVSTAMDIDDYYVYDRNPNQIQQIFSEIIYKHISTELPKDYLKDTYNIQNSDVFIQTLFTSKSFSELVRASEGVVRDFINIFISAFFDAQRKGKKKIEQLGIIEAARQWFEKDKSENLDEYLIGVLNKIIDEVIGNKKARSFMVSRTLEKHPGISRLFDLRIIHLIHKGYADKDHPGIRYNIYSLDYGTYVDLKKTTKEPKLDFSINEENDADVIVPFDDKRSIRRIILTEEILN